MTMTCEDNKMTPEVREALEASIKHWEENRDARSPADVTYSVQHCALCQLFFYNYLNRCSGCPIQERTGRSLCEDTPYEDAVNARTAWKNGYASQEDFQTAAQAEVDFLKNLLPPEN